MNSRTRRRGSASKLKSKSQSPGRSPLDLSEGEEKEEANRVLSTTKNTTKRRGRRPLGRSKSHDDTPINDDDDDDESEEEEEKARRGRARNPLSASMSMASPYQNGASYLPTAYGGGGGADGTALGGAAGAARERSVDRIRARSTSTDRRRDISKERGSRRDRSQSRSRQSKSGDGSINNDRAAQRRADRRASLEASLGVLSMDDSCASFDQSVSSMVSDAPSLLIHGMDSSLSSNANVDTESRRSNRRNLRRTQSRDSTSTDYTATQRQNKQRKPPPKTKTWDGRLDDVLNRRRARNAAAGK